MVAIRSRVHIEQLAQQDYPVKSADVRELLKRVEELEAERDNLRLQAQAHAQEARTQVSIVREICQECTGKTGELGTWNGAGPVKKALKDVRNNTLEDVEKAMRDLWLNVEDRRYLGSLLAVIRGMREY